MTTSPRGNTKHRPTKSEDLGESAKSTLPTGFEEPTFSTGQAAAWLQVSTQTIRDRIKRGEIQAVITESGRNRITKSELARCGAGFSGGSPHNDEIASLAARLGAGITDRLQDALFEAVAAIDVQPLAVAVADALRAREEAAARADQSEQRLRAALAELAQAPWWRRRQLLRALSGQGLIG